MRITAGKHRGRRLAAPPGRDIRPTADRTRQALFNILEHGGFNPGGGSPIREAVVLDAFAGTGALGLEALSRGAAHAVFMDMARPALDAIRENVEACGEDATILRADATRPPPPPTLCIPPPPQPSPAHGGRGGKEARATQKSPSPACGGGVGERAPAKATHPATIAFLDPPYHSALAAPALTALAAAGWLAKGAICVAELAADEDFVLPEGFEMLDERRYGAAKVVLVGYGGDG